MSTAEYNEFFARYQAGQPVFRSLELVDDLVTPIGVYLKLAAEQPYSFLLESSEPDQSLGRYSIIGSDPDAIWKLHDGTASLRVLQNNSWQSIPQPNSARSSFAQFIDSVKTDLPAGCPAQSYGIYGFLAYEALRLVEPAVKLAKPRRLPVPDGIYFRPQVIAVFDRLTATIHLTVNLRPQPGLTAEAAYRCLTAKLAGLQRRLQSAIPASDINIPADAPAPLEYLLSKQQFGKMIQAAKQYIEAGDIYQIVLSQPFQQRLNLSATQFYRALRRVSPSTYLFLLQLDGFQLIGASPELMIRLRNNEIMLRPLAGTRPRGADSAEDDRLAKELAKDPKELAEHLMLLDLGRNDAGRYAAPDSVEVVKAFSVEKFSRVMHLSTTVIAKPHSDSHPLDIFLAALPAGTTTGAPKVRAMQLIEQLEHYRRSYYAGTIGYFDSSGNFDSCIALRTSLLHDGVLHFQAGCGVVVDSDADNEYQESINKARNLVDAIKASSKQENRESDDISKLASRD